MVRAPRSIGAYRVITLIGVGASSSVYRAVRADDDAQVAIKVLADNHSAMAESRRRFTDEWKLLARVDHPSIATIYDAGETEDGQPYMVLELANRGDLRTRVGDLVERGQQIDVADVRAVADHLHDALSALHGEGVVHRDISPSNILIRGDSANGRPPMVLHQSLLEPGERLLLSDLGFAKRLADASGLTRGGGTEGFAAPEQRSAVSIVDQRADLFSATALIRWLAADTVTTEQLDRFVATGTAEDPDDRHPDIDAWYQDLDEVLASAASPRTGAAGLAAGRVEDDDGAGRSGAALGAAPGRAPGLLTRLTRPLPGLRGRSGVLAAVGVLGLAAVAALLLWPTPTSDTARAGTDEAAASPEPESGPSSSASSEPASDSPVSSSSPAPESTTATSSATTDPSASTTITTSSAGSSTSSATSTPPPSSASTASTAATSSPATSRPTTTTSSSTVNTASTATTVVTTSTTAATSTSNPFPFSPRAYIERPVAGATVSGTLVISGTVTAPDGVAEVQLVIHQEATGDYWHDDPGAFQDDFIRFPVEVARPGAVETTWTYRLDAADLQPGNYRLRVWGRAVDGTGDPLSDVRTITITN